MKKPKVYTVNAFGEIAPAAAYSNLKTLCEQWNVIGHYHTIWRWLRDNDQPYNDGKIVIKQMELIRAIRTMTGTAATIDA